MFTLQRNNLIQLQNFTEKSKNRHHSTYYTTIKIICGHIFVWCCCYYLYVDTRGFPAITLALVDRSFEFLMQKTWPPHAILVSEWPIYKNNLLLMKLLYWLEPNFTGMMFIMSSTKFSHFILIGEQNLSATCNSRLW